LIRRYRSDRRWLIRALLGAVLSTAALVALVGCGGREVEFRYPGEEIDFSLLTTSSPQVYIDIVRDLRSAEQRLGEGRFMGISYPSDEQWTVPVVQLYRDALVQDLTETNLVEIVPLISQADFTLSADIVSLGARLQRNLLNFLVPFALGFGAGMVLGDDTSGGVKIGALLGTATMLAIPTPTSHRAECEVKLTLRDREGEIVWQRACLGLLDKDIWRTATSRDDQDLVDEYLATAVKRANACLLGQLRQVLITEGF